jgi:hypothetical protein
MQIGNYNSGKMKTYNIIIRNGFVLLVLCFVLACKQEIEVVTPEFSVEFEDRPYKVGEPVKFKFSGEPGLITFYSGQLLNDYAYHEGRIVPAGAITMSMTVSKPYVANYDQITILASTDFNGKYTIDDVKAATWRDITSRFTIPMAITAGYIPAGSPNISDLMVEDKPLYVVIRYIELPTHTSRSNWLFQQLKISSSTVLGSETLMDQTGFRILITADKNPGRSTIAASGTVTLRGNNTGTRVYTEDWCISGPITSAPIDKGPDRPIVVKNNSDPVMNEFSYEYTTPGTYKVYFKAMNANLYGAKEVLKEAGEITIVP